MSNMKSLRKRGQGAGATRRGQEFGRALKRGRIGQHGKAGCTSRLIGTGKRRRIEIGADQALGGLAFLISAINA
jgi:hypothetical protein